MSALVGSGRGMRNAMRTKLRVATCATAFLALAAAGALHFGRDASASAPSTPEPPPPAVAVETSIVSDSPLRHTVTAVGSLRAIRQVILSSEIGGRVTAIHFRDGDYVAAGTPLVYLFSEPQNAELARSRADEVLARLQLQRTTQLNRRQAAAQADVDNRQAAFDRAKAIVAAAEAVIEQHVVRAPFSGYLGIRRLDLGQYLSPGQAVATLTDLNELFVDFALPQRYLADLFVGQTVEIATDAAAGRFTARLETIEPQVDSGTRNIVVRARLSNPQRRLRPGLYATATVILTPENGTVSVPETAIVANAAASTAFVVRDLKTSGEGQIERVPVKTGRRVDGRIVVSGLTKGEIVVVSGQLRLSPGQKVRPVAGKELEAPTAANVFR